MAGNKPLPMPAPAPALAELVAGSNAELVTALGQLARGAGAAASLYLWGDSGSGKSALLRAACDEARRAGRPACFVAGGGSLPPLGGGLLATDDAGALEKDAQITLFDWHNRAAAGAPLCLLASGDCAPARLPLHADLVSRLAAGLVFRIQPLSDDEKHRALTLWAKRRSFTLPADAADLLLTRLPRNMHTLTAALAELDEFFMAQQKPLTARRARAWLAALPPRSALLTSAACPLSSA